MPEAAEDGGAGQDASSGGSSGERAFDPVELTETALERWGRRLGRAATEPGEGPGVFVALVGPLGAGKTTLVRAACRGAGVEGTIRSPTFTLHNHHRPRGRRAVHHLDLYRLDAPEELDALAWDDLLAARGAVFVEWAERAGDRLPADRWQVRLEMADAPDRRRVAAARYGDAPRLPAPGEPAED